MKFSISLLALAATALAGGDWDNWGKGGDITKGQTVYTTVTICPVTNTKTSSGT